MSFSVDTRELERMEKDIKIFAKRALPFATKQALNDTAWNARAEMQHEIGRKMTERNKWTRNSVRVVQARTLDIRKQSSEFGSIEEYMIKQEFGGFDRTKGKHGVAIPTGYSAGQEGSRPRTRLPRKPNKVQNIRLTRARTRLPRKPNKVQNIRLTRARVRASNRKMLNMLLVKEAAEKKLRYVFMDLGRRKGFFRILGTKKKPKVKMVADVSHKLVRIKPTPTMEPAAMKARRRMPEHYREAMIFQLRRQKVWGY
jgi:hypothetical protein